MTQIEKEAFFALYYGQKVWRCENHEKTMVVDYEIFPYINDCKQWLQLKSIESITDEDAKLLGFKGAYDFIHYLSFGQQFLQEEADKLRELGYLVPFRQYSTEQLIESGIVKI